MIKTESDEIIVRSLLKEETSFCDCDISAAVFTDGGSEGCFAVVSKESKRIIGVILCPEEELTITIKESERDRGYGAQALTLALQLLFGVFARKKVTAICGKEQLPAVKTLLSCGMNRVKETERQIYWSLTMEEWELL